LSLLQHFEQLEHQILPDHSDILIVMSQEAGWAYIPTKLLMHLDNIIAVFMTCATLSFPSALGVVCDVAYSRSTMIIL
jgi:hypothetical protein